MKESTVETTVHEKVKWERFIQPETPEQPLIRVCRNIEKECFEAVFALELVGVGRRTKQREEGKKEEQQEGKQERYKKLLLSGLSSDQSLDFVYSGGKTKYGKTYFAWTIKGHSQGATCEDAVDSAKKLWQNLHVIAGTLKNEYSFAPVIDEKKLHDDKDQGGWVGMINRIGVAINADTYVPMGFLRQDAGKTPGASVVVVPETGAISTHAFDSLALGAAGCASEVRLTLSIAQVCLSDDQLKRVSSALRWLRNGAQKQIRFHEEAREGSDDKEILASIENSLELWMESSVGYQVSCTAFSKQPIPTAFLKLVGSELFSGPFSVEVVKAGEASHSQLHLVDGVQDNQALDLQGCINNIALLPSLFPSVETLHKCNVKRAFDQAALDMQQDGIFLGKVGNGSSAGEVRFSRIDRSRHAYVIGSTGTGKSTLLFQMIKQDILAGDGVCLIDPHGDLHQQVLRIIPADRAEDVVIVDPSDFDRAVGINFLETGDFNKNVQMNFLANEMIKIFDKLYDLRSTGGPIFEQYMRNAMLLAMDNSYADVTLCDIPRIFEDADFRHFLKKGCKSPLVESFWTLMAEKAGGDVSLNNVAPYITSKLTPFIYNALLRPIIGQPKSTINFREIMDEKKILLVNLSKGLLGEMDTQLLGMLIIGKIFSSAMGRVSMRPEDRKPFYLYIDECQNFTTDSVAYLLSEARKFGLGLTLANQCLGQIRESKGQSNILDAVLGNVGSMFMMRLGVIDSEVMSLYMKPELDSQDLQNLPDYHVAARLLSRNAPSKPFVFKTMPMAQDGNDDRASKIKVLSRLKYATDTNIVEAEIIARRTRYGK